MSDRVSSSTFRPGTVWIALVAAILASAGGIALVAVILACAGGIALVAVILACAGGIALVAAILACADDADDASGIALAAAISPRRARFASLVLTPM